MANNQLLASDNFASGSLAAGWGAFPGLSESQIVSGSPNTAQPNTPGTAAGQIWTGLTWPKDQVSEATITLGASSSDTVGLVVRFNSSVQSGYFALINGSGDLVVYIFTNGTPTVLGSLVSGLTLSVNDVWTFQAAGAALTVYQNFKRLFYFYDTTYTSGSPGFDQNSVTATSNSKVSSWRGYSAVQQDGVWQKQGVVIAPVLTDLDQATAGVGIQAWSVFQDTNAQILSGTVFKTWLVSDWSNDAASAMYYAESSDGVNWTREASAVLASVTNGFVVKNGSTYYLYGQASGSSGSGNMLVYTSTDGINWSEQTPTSVIGKGSGGAWDSGYFYNIIAAAIVGGTWYGYYNADDGGQFSTGLATSSDGINWTKSASNPVITNRLPSNALVNVAGVWYMWCTAGTPGVGGTVLDPFEILLYSSTNLTSWTFVGHALHHTQLFESVNAVTGGLTPISILNVGGKSYIYTNSSQNDGSAPQIGQIGLAIAPAPIASIILFSQDGSQPEATEAFTSGTGNLDSNWTTPTGLTKLQIVSGNLCEASATSTVCGQAYTGATIGANQYAEVTIETLSSSNDFLQPAVRMALGAKTYYTVGLAGATGSADSTSQFSVVLSGTTTPIGPTFQITTQVGDVFRLSVVTGSDGFPVLTLFQNGFSIAQVQDQLNSITSGYPGMLIYTPTLVHAQASLFAAGNANVIPAYTSSGGQGNQPAGNVIFDLDGDGYPIAELQTGTDA